MVHIFLVENIRWSFFSSSFSSSKRFTLASAQTYLYKSVLLTLTYWLCLHFNFSLFIFSFFSISFYLFLWKGLHWPPLNFPQSLKRAKNLSYTAEVSLLFSGILCLRFISNPMLVFRNQKSNISWANNDNGFAVEKKFAHVYPFVYK